MRVHSLPGRAWLMLIMLVNAACNSPLDAPQPSDASDTPVRGGTLRTAHQDDLRSLDPAALGDGLAPEIVNLIYAGLVDYGQDGLVKPDLAERFETLDDGLLYRFYLRKDARFQDGEALTAADVKRSMERALAEPTPNSSKSFYSSIKGFEAFSTGKASSLTGVQVVAPHVLDIRLHERNATFLPILAMLYVRPVCKSMGQSYDAKAKPCGAGPFALESWQPGMRVTLRRHEGYHARETVYLDRFQIDLHTTYAAQRMKLERGELDLIREFLQTDLLRFQNDSRWAPFGKFDAPKQVAAEGMNTEMPPFDNAEFRRAVASAIDRRAYRLIKPSVLTELTQPVPPGLPGHDPDLVCQTFDLEKALRHMEKAGYPYDPKTGKGGYPYVIPYYGYRQGLVEHTAQILQQQLRKIGIRIELRLVSFAAWIALSHRPKETAFSYQGWSMDFPDPSDFLEPLFHSSAINEEDSNNASFYRSKHLDSLLDQGRTEQDPSKRKATYDAAIRTVCDDSPWAYTYAVRFYNQWQPYVRGYEPHPVWADNVKNAWLSKPTRGAQGHLQGAQPKTLPRYAWQ
jgi:ABC-type transport system substrate-binding protein